jgi:hypothetical protein
MVWSGATVVVVELEVVVGSVVVVVELEVVVGSVVVVVELEVVVGSVVVVVELEVVVGATVVVVDLGGLVGLGGLGFAPADGSTTPTATAVATSVKTMTRRRMPGSFSRLHSHCLGERINGRRPRRSLPRCFRGLGQKLNQSRVVSKRPLRLTAVMPVATPTPLAPLPAESLES